MDDIEEKLERLLTLYEEDRKRFSMLPFASPHCPPCTPLASSPSPPAFFHGQQQHHHHHHQQQQMAAAAAAVQQQQQHQQLPINVVWKTKLFCFFP